MWFLTFAHAADLPALATSQGHRAALEALDALVAASKPKKLGRALADAGLDRVQMPVRAFFGAELSITGTTPLTACTWDGRLACTFGATSDAPIAEGEYAATCKSSMGSRVPVAIRLVQPGTSAVFAVDDARACWNLGDELLLHPVADDALNVIGQGDEFTAPELTGLKKTQVEAEITKRSAEFRRCGVRGGPKAAGVVVVDYHLDAQGKVDRAEVASTTLSDAAVEACLLDQMKKLRFPPPAGGYEGGTYPFTFQ